MKELNQLNIDNLTSLWKKMGVERSPEFSCEGLNISHTWPNRFWFDWSETANQVATMNDFLSRLPAHAIVPVWMGVGDQADQLEQDLRDENFQVLFQQLAMYLDLQSLPPQEITQLNAQQQKIPPLDIISVQSSQELAVWTETASSAFGYWIDIAAIQLLVSDPNVNLLLVKQNGQPAGTALIYTTGKIIGTHLVGVRESFRGQGIARKIMQQVIRQAVEAGGQYLTLQASVAGEPLYRNLGFVPQFFIKNYKRTSE